MRRSRILILALALAGAGGILTADTPGTLKKLPVYRRLPRPYFCHGMVAVRDYIYVIGGHGSGKRLPDVYYAKATADGMIGPWGKGPALPPGKVGFLYHTVTAGKDCIYVMGGAYKDQSGKDGVSDEVWFSRIGEDGKPGPWAKTSTLPAARKFGAGIIGNGRIYYIGGQYNREIYAAMIKPDGSLDKWEEAGKLPTNLYGMEAVCADGFLYVIGGCVLINRQSEKVFRAKIMEDGTLGKWRRTESLPAPLGLYAMAVKGREVFVFGGSDKKGLILKSTIDGDSHFTAWKKVGEMPEPAAQSYPVVRVGDNIYFGGGIITGKTNKVLRAMYSMPFVKEGKEEEKK